MFILFFPDDRCHLPRSEVYINLVNLKYLNFKPTFIANYSNRCVSGCHFSCLYSCSCQRCLTVIWPSQYFRNKITILQKLLGRIKTREKKDPELTAPTNTSSLPLHTEKLSENDMKKKPYQKGLGDKGGQRCHPVRTNPLEE